MMAVKKTLNKYREARRPREVVQSILKHVHDTRSSEPT